MNRNARTRTLLLTFALGMAFLPMAYSQGGYDTPKKTDTFDAGPETTRTKPTRSVARKPTTSARSSRPASRGLTTRLRRGQIVQVLQSSSSARPEMAFYLPREATSVVQVVVERKGSQVNYFLKVIGKGNTVGGAVERSWLDREGFRPRNAADEARIQAALQRKPLYIEVQ